MVYHSTAGVYTNRYSICVHPLCVLENEAYQNVTPLALENVLLSGRNERKMQLVCRWLAPMQAKYFLFMRLLNRIVFYLNLSESDISAIHIYLNNDARDMLQH